MSAHRVEAYVVGRVRASLQAVMVTKGVQAYLSTRVSRITEQPKTCSVLVWYSCLRRFRAAECPWCVLAGRGRIADLT